MDIRKFTYAIYKSFIYWTIGSLQIYYMHQLHDSQDLNLDQQYWGPVRMEVCSVLRKLRLMLSKVD